MGLVALSPFFFILLLSTPVSARLLDEHDQWPESYGHAALPTNAVAIEVSERLFDRTSLIVQTRYEASPLKESPDFLSSLLPQMTAHWRQSCLVEITPDSDHKVFLDVGFGYELRRYAFFNIFSQNFEYYWEPSLIIPMTIHLDSFFRSWNTQTLLQVCEEVSPDSHGRMITLIHQMLSQKDYQRDFSFNIFAAQNSISYNDSPLEAEQNYRLGVIVESDSL